MNRFVHVIAAAIVLAALLRKPAALAVRLVIRELRHLKHIVLENVICRLYRRIVSRIDGNQVSDWKTMRMIQRYERFKKAYKENYEKEHPREEK